MFQLNLFNKDNQYYLVPNSLRFDGRSSYLKYTPGFGGINYRQTQSVWFKLSRQGTHNGILLSSWKNTSPIEYYWLWQIINNKLYVYHNNNGTTNTYLNLLTSTDQLFTDINGWYNIVAILDTHEELSSNRLKIYLNGELITRWDVDNRASITRYTEKRPFAHPGISHALGKNYPESDNFNALFEGYMADYHLFDGKVVYPNDLGKYLYYGNKKLWTPKYSDTNHNTNGVNLKFLVNDENNFSVVSQDYKPDPDLISYIDQRDFIQGTPNPERDDFFGFTYLSDLTFAFGNASLSIPNNRYQNIKQAKCMTIPISGVFDAGNSRFKIDTDWTIETWVYPTDSPPATGLLYGNANGLGKTMGTLLCFHESTGIELSKKPFNDTIVDGTQWGIYVGLTEPGASPYIPNSSRGSRNKLFNYNPTGLNLVRSTTPADSAQRQGLNVFGLFHGYYPPYIIENYLTSSPQSGKAFFTPSIQTKYFLNQTEANSYFSSIGTNPNPQSPTGNYFLSSTSTLTLNTWNHIAITHYQKAPENSNLERFDYYLNGVHVGRDTELSFGRSSNLNKATGYTNYLTIGGMPVWDSGSLSYVNPFYGYIDDLKISTGIYYGTGGFSVPSSALKTDNNTILYAPFDGSNNGLRTTYYFSGTRDNIFATYGFNSGDSSLDSPSFRTFQGKNAANYAILNSLNSDATSILNGGLTLQGESSVIGKSNFGIKTGKWYWEVIAKGNEDCFAGIYSDYDKAYAVQRIFRAQLYAFRLNLDVFPPTLEYSQTADNFSAYWTPVPIVTGARARPGDYYYPFLQTINKGLAEINFGQKPFKLWKDIYSRENITGYANSYNTSGYWRSLNTVHLDNLAINPKEHLQIKEFNSQDIMASGEFTSVDFGTGDNPSLFMLVKGKEATPAHGTTPALYYEPIIVPNRNLLGSGNNLYLQINSQNPAYDLGVPADTSFMGKRWYNLDTFNGRIAEVKFLSGRKRTSDFGQSVAINNLGTSIVIGAPNINSSHLVRPYSNSSSFSTGSVVIFTGLAGNISFKNTEITGLRSYKTGEYPYYYNFIFDSNNDWVWPTKNARYGMWVGYGAGVTEGFYQTGYTGLQNGILTGATTSNAFGYSVSVNSDSSTIVVGAPKTSYIKSTGVFPSIFDSSSWIQRSVAFDISSRFCKIAQSNDGKYKIAISSYSQMYVSSDYGINWINKSSNNPYLRFTSVDMSEDGKYQIACIEDDLNLWESLDYGTTWKYKKLNVTPVITAKKWTAISVSKDYKYQTLVAEGDKIYISDSAGNKWIPKENNRSWKSVAVSSDGQYQIAAGYGTNLYVSSDKGLNWTAREYARSWASVSISEDGKYQMAVDSTGSIYNSQNNGLAWTDRNIIANWSSCSMNRDGRFQFASATGTSINSNGVWMSINTGISWNNSAFSSLAKNDWREISISSDGRQLIGLKPYLTNSNIVYTSSLNLLNNTVNTMTNAGMAYVFNGSLLNYNFSTFFTGDSNLHGQENFGHKVKINQDGNLIVIGAPQDGQFKNGAVYIYTGSQNAWSLCKKITGSSGSYLGWDIDVNVPSISSGRHVIAAGAPGYSQELEYPSNVSEKNVGQVYIITGSGSNFNIKNIITNPSYPSDSGCFGYSIGMNASGNVIVIGAPSGNFDPKNVYTIVSGIYRIGSNQSYYNQLDSSSGAFLQTGFLNSLGTLYNAKITEYNIPTGILKTGRTAQANFTNRSGIFVSTLSLGTGLKINNNTLSDDGWACTGFVVSGTSASEIQNANNQENYWQFTIGCSGFPYSGLRVKNFEGLKFKTNNTGPRFWSLLFSGQNYNSFQTLKSSTFANNTTVDLSLGFDLSSNPIVISGGTSGTFRVLAQNAVPTIQRFIGTGIFIGDNIVNGDFKIFGDITEFVTGAENYANFRMNAPFLVQTNQNDFPSTFYNNLFNFDKRHKETTLKGLKQIQTNFPGRNVFISTTGYSGNLELNIPHGISIGDSGLVDFGAAGLRTGQLIPSNTFKITGVNSLYDLAFNCGANIDYLSSGYCRLIVPNKNIDGTGKAYVYFSPIDQTGNSMITGITGDYNKEARITPNIYPDINFGFGSIRRPYSSLFGHSVAMSDSGHVVFVGAPKEFFSQSFRQPYNNLPDAGSIYTYTGQGGSFIRNSKLTASNRNQYNNFGSHIAINRLGDFIIVGSNLQNNSNAVVKAGDENIFNYSGAGYVFNLGRPKTKDFFNPPSGTIKFTAYNFGSNDNKLSYPFVDTRGKMEMLVYTGNSLDSRNIQYISHNLEKTPAFVITKCMTQSSDWWIWHHEMEYNYSSVLLNKNLPVNNSGAYLLKNLINYGPNNEGSYTLTNVSGILETTSASRITGLYSDRSPVIAFRIPKGGNITGFDPGFTNTGIFFSGLSLGPGLTGTKPNTSLNGWLVSGFHPCSSTFTIQDIYNSNDLGKYWQFGIGYRNANIPTNPLTGFVIKGISGLSVITNTTPGNVGPKIWGLLYSIGDQNHIPFQTPITQDGKNYITIATYSGANTANQVLNLSSQWNSTITNSGFALGYDQTGFFRIVGVGDSNLKSPTGFAIMLSGIAAPINNDTASTSGFGIYGQYRMQPYQTPIITTSGSYSVIPSDTTRELIGSWNGITGSSGPYGLFTNRSFIAQGTGNISGETYFSLLFGETEGGSKFGSYIGNGLANGPFVTTNFSPKLIIIKNMNVWPATTNAEKTHWIMIDNYNNKTNPATNYYILNKNSTILNTTENNIEFFSNGFKIKSADSANCLINMNAQKYIFAAFAESPFKYNNSYTGV